MKAFVRACWVGIGLLGLLEWGLRAESHVRLISGKVVSGKVSWDPAGISVRPSTGDPIRVPVAELIELNLDEAVSESGVAPERAAPNGPPSGGGAATNQARAIAPGWVGVQVGAGPPGVVTEDAEGWKLEGGGPGLLGSSDSFFFAQQRLESSGQLVARLESFQGTQPEAMAGIVIRDNLGESAAYAFVGFRGGTGLCFQYRQIASGMTMRTTNLVLPMPVWLRLVRSGGAVVADVSADGRQWQNLARGNVNLGQSVRAGMAVAAGAPNATVTARFRDTVVGARGIGYAPGSGYPKVVMRGGSVLIAPVESADDSVVRLGGVLQGALVSTLNVARIEYVPLTPELQERAEADRQGVLLVDGDFLDGRLRSIATNSVTLSSLLYGFRSFAAGSEAGWLQVGVVEPEDAAFRVLLQNGSELRARQVELGTNAFRAESPLLGSLWVRRDDLKGLRRIVQGR